MGNLYYCTYINDSGDIKKQMIEGDSIVDAVDGLETAMRLIDVKVKEIIAVELTQRFGGAERLRREISKS